MRKITLQPGVWTEVAAARFIQSKSNRSGIRIHYSFHDDPVPAPDTDLYFVTQEFDLKPFAVPEVTGVHIHLMPDEDMPVEVVTF
ncbi:hypothetical protein [Rhizobium leguminosarum]|uniref:hypothetical protein n=1 Tax=Rhizobium leguminosarum TaxID=384 RepID=UPI00102FDC33|nr:hypothetical protein [Rhizobium leguminosarum]TAY66496.1 hypothetical protein ELH82_09975 [Rhizobium leguminosarum]